MLGRQIYDSTPGLSAWLIRRAARRLPVVADREQRAEEWLAHLHDAPGLAGLYHAAGSLLASYRILLPFETAALRCSLWLIWRCFEITIHFGVMRPHAKRTEASLGSATKAELEAALEFTCKIAAERAIFRLARSQLPKMEVDRAMLRSTLLSFRFDPKR